MKLATVEAANIGLAANGQNGREAQSSKIGGTHDNEEGGAK